MSEHRYPLSPLQQAHWRAFKLDEGSREWNRGTALVLGARPDVAALAWAWGRVVARHAALRYAVDDGGGAPVQ
ncbi:MAG TPA: condensation domain-containing protein, partial [Polyangiaceae bacterium]|nr:condensation domain-containing protein [Polyangiaceae bacterium]